MSIFSDIADGIGNLFSSSGGKDSFFSAGNILGALNVGSQILSNYNAQGRQEDAVNYQKEQAALAQQNWQKEFEFQKQKWLDTLAKGSGGGGGGSGDALRINQNNLVAKAYDNMIAAARQGRADEAAMLGSLLRNLQLPLLRGGGQ